MRKCGISPHILDISKNSLRTQKWKYRHFKSLSCYELKTQLSREWRKKISKKNRQDSSHMFTYMFSALTTTRLISHIHFVRWRWWTASLISALSPPPPSAVNFQVETHYSSSNVYIARVKLFQITSNTRKHANIFLVPSLQWWKILENLLFDRVDMPPTTLNSWPISSTVKMLSDKQIIFHDIALSCCAGAGNKRHRKKQHFPSLKNFAIFKIISFVKFALSTGHLARKSWSWRREMRKCRLVGVFFPIFIFTLLALPNSTVAAVCVGRWKNKLKFCIHHRSCTIFFSGFHVLIFQMKSWVHWMVNINIAVSFLIWKCSSFFGKREKVERWNLTGCESRKLVQHERKNAINEKMCALQFNSLLMVCGGRDAQSRLLYDVHPLLLR